MLERLFKLSENRTNVRTEVVAGFATFMTMAYMVRKSKRDLVEGVINIDGSCRPQIVPDNNSVFCELLKEFKQLTGHGIVLNTSFNLHGDPLVCSPRDAIKTMTDTGCEYMAIGDFLVRK